MTIQYAVVAVVVDGQPFLRFAGEEENSPKTYLFVKSYIPTAGDKVLLINDVIVGGW